MDSNIPDLLSTLDRWSLLVGALLPVLIAAVNRAAWPGWAKLACSATVCLIASAVTAFLNGSLNGDDVVGSLILIGFTTYSTYHWAWKPSGVAQRVENATG